MYVLQVLSERPACVLTAVGARDCYTLRIACNVSIESQCWATSFVFRVLLGQ
jgi:hypothetical protein